MISLEDMMKMSNDELMALVKEMEGEQEEYYCSASSKDRLAAATLEDFAEWLEDEEIPNGYVIVSDGITHYFMTAGDFQEDSAVHDEPLMQIEYFENGIPGWLKPYPGIRIYLAEWDGQWQFTKVSGI